MVENELTGVVCGCVVYYHYGVRIGMFNDGREIGFEVLATVVI
jgi:hypothetical protein